MGYGWPPPPHPLPQGEGENLRDLAPTLRAQGEGQAS